MSARVASGQRTPAYREPFTFGAYAYPQADTLEALWDGVKRADRGRTSLLLRVGFAHVRRSEAATMSARALLIASLLALSATIARATTPPVPQSCSTPAANCSSALTPAMSALVTASHHSGAFSGYLYGLACVPAGKRARCSWSTANGLPDGVPGDAGGTAVVSWARPRARTAASLPGGPPAGIYTVRLFGYVCVVTVPPAPRILSARC